jgi:hypothetical protein
VTDSYRTDTASAVVPRAVPLGAVWITHHPVEDPAPAGPGLAHLDYAGALDVAARVGARLPTRAEVFALHAASSAAGTELVPCILPDAEQRAAGAVPGDPAMASRAWCDRHDGRVLEAMPRDGDAPVGNAGKHWIGPAPPDLAALCGWFVGGAPIQSGLGFPHNRGHFDYGTTTMLVWDHDPGAERAP